MNVQCSLHFNTTTEVPLSKALNPQLLPGRRSLNAGACLVFWGPQQVFPEGPPSVDFAIDSGVHSKISSVD